MTTTSNNNSLTASNNPNLTMQFLTELLAQEPQQVGTRVYSGDCPLCVGQFSYPGQLFLDLPTNLLICTRCPSFKNWAGFLNRYSNSNPSEVTSWLQETYLEVNR